MAQGEVVITTAALAELESLALKPHAVLLCDGGGRRTG